MEKQQFDLALLSGVAMAGGAGLLQEGQHVVKITDMVPAFREPKDGSGWVDSTPEVEVKLGNSDGVISMWLNPVAFLKVGGSNASSAEDIKAAIDAIAKDGKAFKVLNIDKTKFSKMTEEQQRNLLFDEVCVDEKYNPDEYYLVRRDNKQRVIDATRSAKGRQIMDRLAHHAGLADEGEEYTNILEAKGAEIGIEVELTAADKLKVKRTMKAEDVE